MRLRSDIWVAAYLRRCAVDNVPAVLRRRGAAEAGAVFVKIDRLDGTGALYGPAPPHAGDDGLSRRFVRAHAPEAIPVPDIEARLAREVGFDPDVWIVEAEDRSGAARLDLAPS